MTSLRDTIEKAAAENNGSLGALTVMSGLTDPYRIDTPANRRDAEWLAQAWEICRARRPIHLRGLHYAMVSTPELPAMPDGQPYHNTAECWIWLQAVGNKARWLGVIPFENITDERNSAPVIHTEYLDLDRTSISLDNDGIGRLWLPDSIDETLPKVLVSLTLVRQAYRLVFIGEKQSLESVLLPLAERYKAELVLPTGELSTTLLYGIAKRAAHDGRPCRVFYFSDFDPTGYHMPIEVARKMQALVDDRFEDLDIQIHRCALTVDQVRHLGLPSTPMKDTERRADKWRERFGVEQTEIDALATLRPLELGKIVKVAVAPYWDKTLHARTLAARDQAQERAQQVLSTIVDGHRDRLMAAEALLADARVAVERVETEVWPVLAEIRSEAEAAFEDDVVDRELVVAVDEIDEAFPHTEITLEAPEPQPEGDVAEALFCSSRRWVEQTRVLREEKL